MNASPTPSAFQNPIAHSPSSLFQFPKDSAPPRLELTEWGGRFPDKPYAPLFLANGRDAMLINLGGTSEAQWEEGWGSADTLNRQLCNGWYRADRRTFSASDSVYGNLVSMFEFAGWPLIRGETLVPRKISQYFDPRTATLTTFFLQFDDRTREEIRFRVETFLTADGLLFQNIEILEAPKAGISYIFYISEPSPGYQFMTVPLARPERFEVAADLSPDVVRFRTSWDGIEGAGFSKIMGATVKKTAKVEGKKPHGIRIFQETELLYAGSRISRVVTVQDNREGDDPDTAVAQRLKRLETRDLEDLRQEHHSHWFEYFSTSSISLPDPTTQFLYDLSRYVMKANHHPSGFQPIGMLPFQWQGAMFWDASFVHEALLGCGNRAESEAICGQIQRLMPAAKALARDVGHSGGRFEWTCLMEEFNVYTPPCRQLHNNAVWAKNLMLENAYAGVPIDRDRLDAVRELLEYLASEFRQHQKTGDLQGVFMGIDEAIEDIKPYDTWTCAVFLAALRRYLKVCADQAIAPEIPGAEEICEILHEILQGNIDEEGVLQSFRGGRIPHWGSLVFDLFPNHEAALPTIGLMSQNYDEEMNLYNFHGQIRYPEKGFPWAGFIAIRNLARAGSPIAHRFFDNMIHSINSFGGFPERVYYHGENYIEWCSSAHAGLVWALNGMFATVVEDEVRLLPGIDTARWQTFAFDNLRIGEGWAASLAFKNGKLHSLTIDNLRDQAREATVVWDAGSWSLRQVFKPGVTVLL